MYYFNTEDLFKHKTKSIHKESENKFMHPETSTTINVYKTRKNINTRKMFIITVTQKYANKKKQFSTIKLENIKHLKILARRLGIRKFQGLYFRV